MNNILYRLYTMTTFKNGFRKLPLFLMSVLVAVMIVPAFSNAAIAVTPYASTTASVQFGPGPVILCTRITTTLHYGQHDTAANGEVTLLQNFLHTNNYLSVNATGYFGSLTLQAVKSFQAQNGLAADGIVGVQTRAHILAKNSDCYQTTPLISSVTPSAAASGTTVTITGTGFTSTGNIVHFSIGGISNITSTNGTSLSFIVPSSIGPYCKPDQACALYLQLLNAGTYSVYVENANGVSNTVSFTITNNANNIPN